MIRHMTSENAYHPAAFTKINQRAREVLARFVFWVESGNVVPQQFGERDQWQS
jgi:hypothetical protein